MITAAALIASAAVIVTYLYTVRTGNARPMHWANALGCVPVALPALLAGAWASVVLTGMFGAAGLYGLLRGRRNA